jgi:L-threonylcarbamoyladenylate synthase
MALIGSDINRASRELDKGNLVGIPTETVYGLAGNALDPKVVAKIFSVKKRPTFDPLIVHIPSLQFLNTIVTEIPEKAERLAKHFWPGPITLVLPRKDLVPDLITSGLSTVAVRVPNHPLTLKLLNQLDYPLASPSANPFGYISPTTAEHVQQQLGDKIPYILNGGPCKVGIESTIIGFESSHPVLYRSGGIPLEEIKELIGELNTSIQTSGVAAPGMSASHYAPGKTLLLGNIRKLLEEHGPEKAGILSLKDHYHQIENRYQIQLSLDGDLAEAARNLFGSLRELDAMPISHIFAELVPNYGLGLAINDRLQRAAN